MHLEPQLLELKGKVPDSYLAQSAGLLSVVMILGGTGNAGRFAIAEEVSLRLNRPLKAGSRGTSDKWHTGVV
jgi:hypothetical protein